MISQDNQNLQPYVVRGKITPSFVLLLQQVYQRREDERGVSAILPGDFYSKQGRLHRVGAVYLTKAEPPPKAPGFYREDRSPTYRVQSIQVDPHLEFALSTRELEVSCDGNFQNPIPAAGIKAVRYEMATFRLDDVVVRLPVRVWSHEEVQHGSESDS